MQLLQDTSNKETHSQVAESLGKIGNGSSEAIAALVELFQSSQKEVNNWKLGASLGFVCIVSRSAISALEQLIPSDILEIIFAELAGIL
ncbi:MAG: hypothetical protein GDA56_00620 [Hormoscilla sp. GM7CHS1pb]|nr:hypothetical protein [Hormoscilla sp. GM7CHS1pb]